MTPECIGLGQYVFNEFTKEKLERPGFLKSVMINGLSCSEYVFGGAQLGMDYGIANYTGKPNPEEVHRMFEFAFEGGVTAFDTASAYGKSEKIIGRVLSEFPRFRSGLLIITKLDPLDNVSDLSNDEIASKVRYSILKSLKNLGLNSLPLLLFHRSEHLFIKNGLILDMVRALQESGVIGALGVSVYDPEEAFRCIEVEGIQAVQIPFNVFDTRHFTAGIIDKCVEKGIWVFARSILLQGLLAVRPESLNRVPVDLVKPLQRFHDLAESMKMKGKQLALAFCRAYDSITGYVIGAESGNQVKENISLFKMPSLDFENAMNLAAEFSDVSESLVNPSNWYHL